MFELVLVERHLDTHICKHVELQVIERLIVLMLGNQRLAEVIQHVVDVYFKTLSEQGVTAFLVDSLTLHVHHVIVVQEVFTHAEMVLFDLLLCLLDLFGDHRVLDHLAFLHSETVHYRSYTLGAEDTHEVVFQRHEEL